jgi:aspartyl-tRNA(Asn)/glutamyl-tRNA(Gln) amidotransferase subunit C
MRFRARGANIKWIPGDRLAVRAPALLGGGSGRSAIIDGMAGLSRSDVEHVAYLARLGLSEAELDRLEGQLNHILDQYAILARLDTEHIAPTAQTIELENILRDDVVTPSLPVEAVLANAPAREGDFIVVPPILGGE